MFLRLIIAILCLVGLPSIALAETDGKPAKAESAKKEQASDTEKEVVYNTVVLQGLNKVTGHISKLDGPLGTVLRFGNLEIIAKRCWKSPPEERPENAALLDIRELTPGEGPKNIFLGWMFSSSPGLSGLEHAVYDVNVLACEYRSDPEQKEGDAKKETPVDATAEPAPKKKGKKKTAN